MCYVPIMPHTVTALRRTCPHCNQWHLCALPAVTAPESESILRSPLMDHATEWFEARCVRVYTSDGWARSADLYRDYVIWANRRQVRPMVPRAFARCLRALGLSRKKRSVYHWSAALRP